MTGYTGTASELRQELVDTLMQNLNRPTNAAGDSLDSFPVDWVDQWGVVHVISWEQWAEYMRADGEWCDHRMVIASSMLFRRPVLIISSLSGDFLQEITAPPEWDMISDHTPIVLGHYHDVHYVGTTALEAVASEHLRVSEEEESATGSCKRKQDDVGAAGARTGPQPVGQPAVRIIEIPQTRQFIIPTVKRKRAAVGAKRKRHPATCPDPECEHTFTPSGAGYAERVKHLKKDHPEKPVEEWLARPPAKLARLTCPDPECEHTWSDGGGGYAERVKHLKKDHPEKPVEEWLARPPAKRARLTCPDPECEHTWSDSGASYAERVKHLKKDHPEKPVEEWLARPPAKHPKRARLTCPDPECEHTWSDSGFGYAERVKHLKKDHSEKPVDVWLPPRPPAKKKKQAASTCPDPECERTFRPDGAGYAARRKHLEACHPELFRQLEQKKLARAKKAAAAGEKEDELEGKKAQVLQKEIAAACTNMPTVLSLNKNIVFATNLRVQRTNCIVKMAKEDPELEETDPAVQAAMQQFAVLSQNQFTQLEQTCLNVAADQAKYYPAHQQFDEGSDKALVSDLHGQMAWMPMPENTARLPELETLRKKKVQLLKAGLEGSLDKFLRTVGFGFSAVAKAFESYLEAKSVEEHFDALLATVQMHLVELASAVNKAPSMNHHGDQSMVLRLMMWDSDSPSRLTFRRKGKTATCQYPPGRGFAVFHTCNSVYLAPGVTHQPTADGPRRCWVISLHPHPDRPLKITRETVAELLAALEAAVASK